MEKVDKILIASTNPAKVERYRTIILKYAKEIIGLKDVGITQKPDEIGETAEENAEIKGRFYAQKTELMVFSEDEALYVDFLPENQQPGPHVRRINKKDEVDDDKLLAHWEKTLAQVPEGKRTGRWHIAYSITSPDGRVKTISLDYPIIFFSVSSKVRIPGWPMSSLQGSVAFRKPNSELTEEEKRLEDKRLNQAIAEKLKELLNLGK